jgi:anti-sigma B factor antagonist
MEFRSEPRDSNITVLHCEGRLNMVSAPELRDVVKEAIGNGRPRIVLDLSGVSFVDSSGLGSLVGCLKNAREAQGDLRLVAPVRIR